jgi:hypothetical protein
MAIFGVIGRSTTPRSISEASVKIVTASDRGEDRIILEKQTHEGRQTVKVLNVGDIFQSVLEN